MAKKDEKKYISAVELAKILGISHVAVFKKIKAGQIPAQKIGRNFAIPADAVNGLLQTPLGKKQKTDIEKAVERTFHEYGQTLRLLGKE